MALAAGAAEADQKGAAARASLQARKKAVERSERIRGLLISKGILQEKARTLDWNGIKYALWPGTYQICEPYNGICYRAVGAGKKTPVVLAVYEVSAQDLDVIVVEYQQYLRDRAQDAIHFFMAQGASFNDVFKLTDPRGRPLFDAAGLLTPDGEAVFQAGLEGKEIGLRVASGAMGPQNKRRWGDPKEAKKTIEKLRLAGYREILRDEYDCLHKTFRGTPDEELNLRFVLDGDKERYFYLYDEMDPGWFIVEQYRKDRKCAPGGTPTFGRP